MKKTIEKTIETIAAVSPASLSGVGEGIPACVVQIYGEPLGRRVPLLERIVSIGRVEKNAIVVLDDTVSRHHARLINTDGSWWIEDLGSRNGTFLNTAHLHRASRLACGDQIKIGRAIFKFLDSGAVEAHFHEAILQMVITDGLTGVANRRRLDEFLHRELTRVTRHQRPLAVIMFDLDYFKRVNDDCGHLAGDEVLRAVATRVAETIRGEELIGRYGGEEFVVVLPETSDAAAEAAAERFRSLIEASPVGFDEHVIRVSASFGVASMRTGDTVKSLVQRADACLYEAKKAGRNCVVTDRGR